MAASFRPITELEFRAISNKIFSDPLTDRRYGLVCSNGLTFAFGWRSDLIEPTVLDLNDKVVLVAVDQEVAIVEVPSGQVLSRISLPDNFHQAILVDERVYLATELSVYQLTAPTWQVKNRCDLPEFFEAFDSSYSQLYAICIDGTKVSL
jgi:hypothetical protein